MTTQLMLSLLNGLAAGMAMFLVAAGLTLVFGVLKILNFAQGSFFMIGAYIAFMMIRAYPDSFLIYLGASATAGIVVGILGLISDMVVFKRLRDAEEAYGLIATFALLMVCGGVTKIIWGLQYYSVQPPSPLNGMVHIGTLFIPVYSIFIIASGIVLYFILEFVLQRMWIGKIIQSVAHDAWMAGIAGVNVSLVFTGAVIFAFFLAGLAGGLLLPNQSLSPDLGGAYILPAFVAVIIGGLGDVRGAFIASIILGLAESVSSVLVPNLPGLAIYVAMVLVLVLRPQGLFKPRSA